MLLYIPDQKLSLVLEDITLSVDVQDVYSKFKMNLGAANIDYFIRERYVLSLVLEDITLSVDVQDVYSKFKMNLGAANIDHFIRERYVDSWNTILDLISTLSDLLDLIFTFAFNV